MIVSVASDEIYPAYFIADDGDVQIQLTEAEIAQVRAAHAAWDVAQEMLDVKYRAAREANR